MRAPKRKPKGPYKVIVQRDDGTSFDLRERRKSLLAGLDCARRNLRWSGYVRAIVVDTRNGREWRVDP